LAPGYLLAAVWFIQATGPAAVISFALTGTLVVLVMRMLGEMAAAYPAVGPGLTSHNTSGSAATPGGQQSRAGAWAEPRTCGITVRYEY